MIEEDKRNNLPKNWESRKRQADWIMQDEAARKEAEEKVNRQLGIIGYKLIETYPNKVFKNLIQRDSRSFLDFLG